MRTLITNVVIITLLFLSIIYSFKLKFLNLRGFKHVFKDIKQNNTYQTFLVSLGSHIGTGNIVGVSSCLILGGSGTVFWMWTFTIFSSVFSYIENVLSLKARERIDGENRSGASFYIYKYLGNKKLAIIVSAILILTNTILFQQIQVNTISESLIYSFKINKSLSLIIILGFTFLFIFRGTKMIVKLEELIVPLMMILYLGISLYVIIFNYKQIPNIFKDIFFNALNIKDIGLASILFCATLGMKRSFFSNEAGLGTIPSISGMSEVASPEAQARIQVFGVFIDTFFCTLTALMILIYHVDLNNLNGCEVIIKLFEVMFDKIGMVFGIFFLITFALATLISQYYLGETNMFFITKKLKIGNEKKFKLIFKLLFVIGIVFGVYLNLNQIFEIIDYTLVGLGIINIYSIVKIMKKDKKIVSSK